MSMEQSYLWPLGPAHMKGKKLEENASGNLAHEKGRCLVEWLLII